MRFLIDEMFAATTCDLLTKRNHDAVHVRDRGVNARPDREVAAVAASEGRVLVTENVEDFAAARDVVVVCLLKSRLPASGMAEHLARLLDRWATENPYPYLGLHWPA
ncbi:MAG TPA: DUF5615 family PIN-like protein [Mycobacterium sp.]|nr:DUF5615 family PIN-like protein [Mycobacterium sp.]